MKDIKINGEKISEVACLTEVDMPESDSVQSYSCLPPGEPSLHEHEWPHETVPYPIARAMEFCFENCRIAQCSKEPTDYSGLTQQKCRFPQGCSIVPHTDKS